MDVSSDCKSSAVWDIRSSGVIKVMFACDLMREFFRTRETKNGHRVAPGPLPTSSSMAQLIREKGRTVKASRNVDATGIMTKLLMISFAYRATFKPLSNNQRKGKGARVLF